MGLVLDTSVLIAAERRRFAIKDFLTQEATTEATYLSSISASELLQGVERANTPKRKRGRREYVEAILSEFPVFAFDLTAARVHASIWAELQSAGTMIGSHDLLIGATAIAQGHRLATLNQGEFERIPGLELANAAPYLKTGK